MLMRAQVSLELLVTLGVVVAFTIPVVLLLLSLSQIGLENATLVQADGSARALADSINEIYAEGSGAKRTVLLSLPISTQVLHIGNREVTIVIETESGEYHAVAPLFASVEETTLEKRGLVALELNVNADQEVTVRG